MDVVTLGPATVIDVQSSGISWRSIAAGAVVTVAVTFILLALGAGLGLSSVSPWADSGVSASTFKIGTGIYLCCVAVMASAIGGYMAARLRTPWSGLHTNEVYFRDTAHGFVAWAFATLISATVLGAATTHIVSGAATGASMASAQAAQSVSPTDLYVDKLLRPGTAAPAAAAAPSTSAPAGNDAAVRAELTRLWTSSFRDSKDLNAADKAYVARIVASRTGLSQAEAERRVNDTITEAKAALDKTRHGAAVLSFWLTASLLLGAFAASLAAVEGGMLRDGNWNGSVLTPRTI
jgi:hypothetical protein